MSAGLSTAQAVGGGAVKRIYYSFYHIQTGETVLSGEKGIRASFR